ncbi:MAG: aminopeptidase N [Alistipes senegalensis]|nr:aminopeptidase N [Oxalobacter formigenes]MCM1281321.1 aminopeptidase N [Alistipes senegalensis]
MSSRPSKTVYRKNYAPPSFLVNTVDLTFELDPAQTRVLSKTELVRNPQARHADIILYGKELELAGITLNGRLLKSGEYTLKNDTLRIANAPAISQLEIETIIQPEKNTSLMGLYLSNGNFFTQCEAEGFRKITYFPDRPDVMAKYTVTLKAAKKQFPVLLSNGNLIAQGDLPKGRHYAKWEDPFKKPSYLFAIVAGKLVCREEEFILASGKKVLLQVWVEKNNLDKTEHAMASLKHSIRWDEKRYGLELDLDRFMIVAVSDFNMGAMENKGLNIFNTRFVLANPEIATDMDYANIESVVGHEYFHNWTGNRVTCRDWFQLSLKEGLTVFRDQEFSADRIGTDTGRAVKRIEDVRTLRQQQFPEDAGAMAHPVRPDSYEEINNFYTATVYEKGAEIVRMYQTLLGKEGFRKGMDLYFRRHDGQAVTCHDFLMAMADANNRDLTQFENWYSQAGTPRLKIRTSYNRKARSFSLSLSQSCPPTPGQKRKKNLLIPFAFGLLDAKGNSLPVKSLDTGIRTNLPHTAPGTALLELTQKSCRITLTDIDEKPVLSALRNFSAPVILEYDQPDEELALLFSTDPDAFNRWEAGQRLALRHLVRLAEAARAEKPLVLPETVTKAFHSVLSNEDLNPALRALALTLPAEATIAEEMQEIDPQAIFRARHFMQQTLSRAMQKTWLATYKNIHTRHPCLPEPEEAGKRSLRNLALAYLMAAGDKKPVELAVSQYEQADNMTDRLAALTALAHAGAHLAASPAKRCLRHFYREFRSEALVVDKWFALQAAAPAASAEAIQKLAEHPAFTLNNPNRARSLIFGFCMNNMAQFHARDGSGYKLWARYVLALDKINPQIAARLSRALTQYNRYIPELKEQARKTLEDIAASPLSRDTGEIIGKILAS